MIVPVGMATRHHKIRIHRLPFGISREHAIDLAGNELNQGDAAGADAPSTIIELCSEEFREIFHTADLVISKGQGNFEGLMNSRHPNIFFLLIAKCRPTAGMLGVDINDMVVGSSKKMALILIRICFCYRVSLA